MVELGKSVDLDRIRAAHERIRPYIHRTPVLTSSRLDEASDTSLFFKCENFQKVGAFKARGATNAVFALDAEVASAESRHIRPATTGPQWRVRRSCAAFQRTSLCRRIRRR